MSLDPSAATEAVGCGFVSLAGLGSRVGFESLDFRSFGFESLSLGSLIGFWAGVPARMAAGEAVGCGAGEGVERTGGVFLSAIMAGV